MRTTPILYRLSVSLLLLCTVACASAARRDAADAGTITVGVTVRGREIDTTVLRVTIDPAGLGGTVRGRSGVVTKSPIPWGEYVVRLVDVPARCEVEGARDRPVSLNAQRRSAALRFLVTCGTP